MGYVIDFLSGNPDTKCAEAFIFYPALSPKLLPESAWMRMQRLAGSLLGGGVAGDLPMLVRGKLGSEKIEKKIEPANVFR